MQTPVPHDLPLPLPAPEWLLVAMLVVSFMIHILFVNMMVGGSVLTVVFEIMGRKRKGYDALAHEVAKTITVNKSLAVVFGVAPLLAINVLYTVYFYTANALTGLMWILIVPLVAAAFLLTYLHKYTWTALAAHKSLHIAIGIAASAIFLVIPLVFLANVNLMLFPDRWPDVRGFVSALLLPNVFPRYFHFVAASLAITGLFLVGYMRRRSYGFETRMDGMPQALALRQFYTIVLCATGAQYLIGPIVYFTLPSHGLSVGMSLVIGCGALCATPAVYWLWREVSAVRPEEIGRHFWRIVAALSLTVALMVSGRHMYRATALSDHQALVREKTKTFAAASEEARLQEQKAVAQSPTTPQDKGKDVFASFCAGCHSLSDRLVGPPVQEMQAIYAGNPTGIVAWTKAPGKKRPDYPQMPTLPLTPEQLENVAQYILKME